MPLFNGKVFGHPVHMMLVHFPAALLPVAAAVDVLAHAGVIQPFDLRVLLIPGVALGWLAAMFGFWDLVRIKSGTRAMTVSLTHGAINATAVSGFTWALALWMQGATSMIPMWIEVFCTLLLLVGNKFGGDLVIRYFIGTNFEKPLSGPDHKRHQERSIASNGRSLISER
jgi:uncharacterized membrane protein